ncbi:glutamate--cysteine ligase, partial [Streptomyces sp. HSW2009]
EHRPSVECRALDVPATAADAAALATLVRALVVAALAAVRRGDPGPALDGPLLRAACWRAARDGWAAQGVDPRTGRLVPTAALVERLFETVRPVLAATGERAQVADFVRRLTAERDPAPPHRPTPPTAPGP